MSDTFSPHERTTAFGAEDGAPAETPPSIKDVREAVLQAVSEGYEHARISGLCGEGAFEFALGYARRGDLTFAHSVDKGADRPETHSNR